MDDWQHHLTAQIAGAIEHHRRARGLSRTELAARCTALGLPTKRPALVALLDGHRQTISVQQLLVLAEALDTSLVDLILPLHTGEHVALVPGRLEHPYDAAQRLFAAALGQAAPDASYAHYARFVSAAERFASANTRLAVVSHRLALGVDRPTETDGRPHPASEVLAAEAALSRLLDARDALVVRSLARPELGEAWKFLDDAAVPRRLPVLVDLDVDSPVQLPLLQYELRAGELPLARLVTER